MGLAANSSRERASPVAGTKAHPMRLDALHTYPSICSRRKLDLDQSGIKTTVRVFNRVDSAVFDPRQSTQSLG
jgi:hypothetical protein